MKFTYFYKSSDGIRHEAEIEAADHNAAFASLRTMGIRPIKVLEKKPEDGAATLQRRMFGELYQRHPVAVSIVALLAVVAFFAGVQIYQTQKARETRPAVQTASSSEVLTIFNKAQALLDRRQAELKLLDLERIRDWEFIESSTDISFLYDELEKGKKIVEKARADARELFGRLSPAAASETRREVQKRYGEVMDELDADELRVLAAESVLVLLDNNRGKWSCAGGRPSFCDAALQGEFSNYEEMPDAETARWKRDFGGVQSKVFTIEQAKETK